MINLESPRLILSPQTKEFYFTDLENFLRQLTELKFLGSKLITNNHYHCFDIGDNFLHQISYLGCSPTLFSAQESDLQTTFTSIVQHDNIQFAHSSSIPPARCPHCNKTDKNWPLYQQHWENNSDSIETCPHCQQSFSFTDMKWKKNGGYGRLFIQVHGIQEQLAIPNQTFLAELATLTKTDWNYFFAV